MNSKQLNALLCFLYYYSLFFARMSALSELLYTDDLVLMSETTEGLMDKFFKWLRPLRAKV